MLESHSTLSKLFSLFFLSTLAALPVSWIAAQDNSNREPPVKLSARYHIESGTNTGFLIVKVDVPIGNHIYSLSQSEPLIPSKLVVKSTSQFQAEKKFKSDKKPEIIERDPLFNARLEKHSGTVQFYVPVRIADNVDLTRLKPEVRFSGQMCSDAGYCVPIDNLKINAKFAGYFQREAKNTIPPLKQKK